MTKEILQEDLMEFIPKGVEGIAISKGACFKCVSCTRCSGCSKCKSCKAATDEVILKGQK